MMETQGVWRKRAAWLGPALTLLAILTGFGLRLYRLGDQNIWWDEGHAIWAARQDLYQTTRITAYDVHPPLYLWLLHGWLRLVGESEFAVRYLSLLGGVLTVALLYVVARRLVGRHAALIATWLIATARFHIWWSQEARMYIWATFFALLSVYFFTRLRQNSVRVWWAYILASAATLYTLYLSALVLFFENVFIALTVWHKPHKRHTVYTWALSQLGVLLLYAPWLYMAAPRIRHDASKASFTLGQVWQLYGTVLTTGVSTDLDRYTWLLVAFGVLAVAGIALLVFDRTQPQRYGFVGWEIGVLLALPLVLPPVVVYALAIPRGFFYSPKPEARYLLLFAPFFYILIAHVLAGFWQKARWGRVLSGAAAVLVLGTCGVLPVHYEGRYLRDDYQTAMQVLAAYAQPGDAVLVVSGDRYPVFLYHYHRQFPDESRPTVYLLPQQHASLNAENVDAELLPLHQQHKRLWLASFERSLQDPDNVVAGWLDARRTATLYVSQGYNYLRLYTLDGLTPTVDPARFRTRLTDEAGETLMVYDLPAAGLRSGPLPTAEFRPGDLVRPLLYVRADRERRFLVRWVHESGQQVDQQVIVAPAAPDRAAPFVGIFPSFAVFEYTPPGDYWIEVDGAGEHPLAARIPAGRVTRSKHLPRGKIERRYDAVLGEGTILFLGYRVRPKGEARAGESLILDLHWQAQRSLEADYTVFAHLIGPFNPATGGPLWAQHDSRPLDGGHPTTRWQPGQTVIDRRVLDIPASAPAGTYQIEVGLYDANTGARVNVAGDEADRILLGNVQVDARP